jgi:hypothetical protein
MLTRLLQPSLGGNSQTHFVCTISSSKANFDMTLETLRLAPPASQPRREQPRLATTWGHAPRDVATSEPCRAEPHPPTTEPHLPRSHIRART